MVASGLGISVLPRDALTPKYHSRLVVPVPFAKPVPSRRVALAYRRSFPRPEAIAAMRDAVAACRGAKDIGQEHRPDTNRPRGYRMATDLTGKVVLITGASTGIGAAAARAFAGAGARVVVHYNASREPAAQVVADIKAAGGEAVLVGGDVTVGSRRQAHRRRVAGGVRRPPRRADQQRGRHARPDQDRGLHGRAHRARADAQLHAGRAVHARGRAGDAAAEVRQHHQRDVDRRAPRRRRRRDPVRRRQGLRLDGHARLGEGARRRRHPRQRGFARA